MPTQRISVPADRRAARRHSSTSLPSYHPYQAGGSAAQLDLARDAGAAVGNGEARYWRMQNGYLLPDRPSGLAQLAGRLRDEKGLTESVRDSLRVGVHLGGDQGRFGRPARTCLPVDQLEHACQLVAEGGRGVRPP